MPDVSAGPISAPPGATAQQGSTKPTPAWSAWRVVIGFGVVSLAADMVYEGARSITGPLFGVLGASALAVGLVTGAGEAMALVLRLAFGPLADRTGRYWSLTLVGYTLTAVCVPLLALAPFLGGAGLVLACVLILTERAGKAVRSPSKSALLAQAAGAVGRGRGFAVHKALDQLGAFTGPLLVAGLVATSGVIWPALAILAVPGAIAIGLLLWIRLRVPDLAIYDTDDVAPPVAAARTSTTRGGWIGADLPRKFFLFATAAGAATAGLVTFGIISFHVTQNHLMPIAAVPLLYAAAMASAAVAALVSGYLYDRWNAKVLFALPILGAAVPALTLSAQTGTVIAGAIIWGAAIGVQERPRSGPLCRGR